MIGAADPQQSCTSMMPRGPIDAACAQGASADNRYRIHPLLECHRTGGLRRCRDPARMAVQGLSQSGYCDLELVIHAARSAGFDNRVDRHTATNWPTRLAESGLDFDDPHLLRGIYGDQLLDRSGQFRCDVVGAELISDALAPFYDPQGARAALTFAP